MKENAHIHSRLAGIKIEHLLILNAYLVCMILQYYKEELTIQISVIIRTAHYNTFHSTKFYLKMYDMQLMIYCFSKVKGTK